MLDSHVQDSVRVPGRDNNEYYALISIGEDGQYRESRFRFCPRAQPDLLISSTGINVRQWLILHPEFTSPLIFPVKLEM